MAAANPQVTFTAPRTVEIVDAGVPEIGPRQVLIRTRCSLISAGTEGSSYVGRQWTRDDGTVLPRYPDVPGYSNVGDVIAVGDEVECFRVGDRVTSSAGHRLLTAMPENHLALWPVPEGLSDEDASFCVLGCTVLNGVRMGHPQIGEAVAVIGLGLLGQLACRYLALTGAGPIIGIDLDDFRLGLARDAGVITHALNPSACDPRAEVLALTEGRGADVVFEVTGRTETYDTAFDLARKFGAVVALGSPRWPAPVDMMKLHLKALSCVGAIVSAHPEPGDERHRWHRSANAALFLDLAARGRMKLGPLVTHRFAHDQAADAYPTAIGERGDALGVVLAWPEG